MKALRYLLSMMAMVSVLSAGAQTPAYGKPYRRHHQGMQYCLVEQTTSLPRAAIGSTGSEWIHSSSSLPIAALSGVVTTYDNPAYPPSRPRRVIGEGDEEETPQSGWVDPMKDPIGDAVVPLLLLAAGYMVIRRKRMQKSLTRDMIESFL